MSVSSFAKQIHTFYSIDIPENSLILCDIDDTVLVFPKYPESFYKESYHYYTSIGYTIEQAKHLIENDCNLYNFFKKRIITDKDGFFSLLEKIKKTNSKLCFLTARYEHYHQLTIKELKNVDIDCTEIPIFYTNGTLKGNYIKQKIDLSNYEHIIFIDDNDFHLENVNKEHPHIMCYKFIHIE